MPQLHSRDSLGKLDESATKILETGGHSYQNLLLPALQNGLSALSDEQRMLLHQIYFSDPEEYDDVYFASQMGCSVRELKKSKSNVLASLRRALKDQSGWDVKVDELTQLVRLAGQTQWAEVHLRLSEKQNASQVQQKIVEYALYFLVAKDVLQKRMSHLLSKPSAQIRFVERIGSTRDGTPLSQTQKRPERDRNKPPEGPELYKEAQEYATCSIVVGRGRKLYFLVSSTEPLGDKPIMKIEFSDGQQYTYTLHSSADEIGQNIAWGVFGRMHDDGNAILFSDEGEQPLSTEAETFKLCFLRSL